MTHGQVPFAFLDGGHGYYDVINDYNLVSGRQDKGDIVVFDDYTSDDPGTCVRAAGRPK